MQYRCALFAESTGEASCISTASVDAVGGETQGGVEEAHFSYSVSVSMMEIYNEQVNTLWSH